MLTKKVSIHLDSSKLDRKRSSEILVTKFSN